MSFGSKRLLTKSRFKIGCECPTKLYFTGKAEYGNNNIDNAFLEALAEGGFQVGELAKIYHPGGVEISTLDTEKAVKETTELLKQENIILYEPAIQAGDLLVRVDVLVKQGLKVELIEVKAKSFDPSDREAFYNRTMLKKNKEQLSSEWEPYLLDVTFQGYVLKKAFPNWDISHYLMLADKAAVATVDGLNQCFFLETNSSRTRAVPKAGLSKDSLGRQLLVKVNVDHEAAVALKMKFVGDRTFEEHIQFLAKAWSDDRMANPKIGSHCKACEFRIDHTKKSDGQKSGFEKCWAIAQDLNESDFKKPFVFDLWNFRKAQSLIEDGRVFIEDIKKTDINPSAKDEPGLSSSERQWLQAEKIINNDNTPFFDRDGLESEFSKFKFPLHFIDFETTMVAIPFNKGRRPYEQMAFQFSHHVVHKDSLIEHKTQYLNRDQGKFPNFDFVRSLRNALGDAGGTIFRYAAHENTVLCQIRVQLAHSEESDKDVLIRWIESITSKDDKTEKWTGSRNMIDLCEMVKKYYYHPKTGGSNSIKKVLPAILSDAAVLHELYSKPVYGAKNGVSSLNFKDWAWIQRDSSGNVIDPYKLLPPVFNDLDLETMDSLITDGSIADGGAAMTAYARMQFTQMSEVECDRVSSALLKYCELDTFAMVMIYQYWKDLIERKKQEAA